MAKAKEPKDAISWSAPVAVQKKILTHYMQDESDTNEAPRGDGERPTV